MVADGQGGGFWLAAVRVAVLCVSFSSIDKTQKVLQAFEMGKIVLQ